MESAAGDIDCEPHSPGSNSQPKTVGKRADAMAILAKIPNPKDVRFDPVPAMPKAPQVKLPPDIDITSPYALFSLFFTENLWKVLTDNTNLYAFMKERKNNNIHHRTWRSVTPNEMKIFVGIQIYMGITREPAVKDYFNEIPGKGAIHPTSYVMSQYRYEQLRRYFHISEPPEVTPGIISTHCPPEPTPEQEYYMSDEQLSRIWWHKVHFVLDMLRRVSKRYYVPSSNVAIDESMVRCFGRSSHTYKAPNKPISQGFKLYVLADHGYIYHFYPASRTQGVIEVGKPSTGLTKTGQMVYELIQTLPGREDQIYHLYLDNFFTSVPLFKMLRDIQVGACGTTRPHGEFPQLLKKLKDLSSYIPFHHVSAIPVDNVLCFAWQDNNIVLGLTTIHTVDKTDDYIDRERRRPQKTSTNGALVRKEFGDSFIKTMPIPRFIDDYNYHMGAVDIANQYRANYETHTTVWRSWWPLWNWCLDATIINAWRLHKLRCEELGIASFSHVEFRKELYRQLFAFHPLYPTYGLQQMKRKTGGTLLPESRLNTSLQHIAVRHFPEIQQRCFWCRYKNPKRQKGIGWTKFSCKACALPLCRPDSGKTCFQDFHTP